MDELFDDADLLSKLTLRVTFDYAHGCIRLKWTDAAQKEQAKVTVTAIKRGLAWEIQNFATHRWECALHASSVRAQIRKLRQLFPVADAAIVFEICQPDSTDPRKHLTTTLGCPTSPWSHIERELVRMGKQMQINFSPLAKMIEAFEPEAQRAVELIAKREEKLRRAKVELQQRMSVERARREEQARQRAVRENQAKQHRSAGDPHPNPLPQTARERGQANPTAVPPPMPVPPVTVRVESPRWETELALGVTGQLQDYLLRERAAGWWVANQTDELLCLPHCAITHLDYQLRTALRVIGPLRGRALLSDEVGLGKTIEAGLVLKEYLTRGLARRFLVLTLPSLVDQWQEELADKFHIATVTTNQAVFRSDPAAFWKENENIVASIHTLKQEPHLAAAQGSVWDVLIVDEAHYLRNRTAKTWQAVNALPRQFLLLLTATPVQNSIEELYHLVTLLKPGQLPSPREFRERFIDPDKPRQPRDAEELRRLLGQVMIRNTRANAGIKLPPRRAETVLFELQAGERTFWQQWERELRDCLATLPLSQASLWGRLLLQAAGSSPAAWRDALQKFPEETIAQQWRQTAPLEDSWRRKVALLLPLAATEGGLVVFTQFLQTQAALAAALRAAGAAVWLINGQTAAEKRQPLTDAFRAHGRGGVLLLTHSGTEGRNLQFCHRLVNFDLPWNPMEIEQRIGRLHRLGQQHAVEIYNLVQAGTLQQTLLEILQEKLNLFELVVGETGLVLGERFGSDDFEEEVWRRWRDSGGAVREAMETLGNELLAARHQFEEVKQVDQALFKRNYEAD